MKEPTDAAARRAVPPVICYPTDSLAPRAPQHMQAALTDLEKTAEVLVPPRDGRCFRVRAGQTFRITSVEGPQVGDMNLWNAADLTERFFSGKTRAHPRHPRDHRRPALVNAAASAPDGHHPRRHARLVRAG